MKSQHCIDTMLPPTAPSNVGRPSWLLAMLRVVHRWNERSRQRRQLAQLSDHALKDIGLTRADIGIELDKPFWQP